MTGTEIWYVGLVVAAAIGLLAVYAWGGYRNRRLMSQLYGMLDEAISGTFVERRFDETQQSALEAKLGQYLRAAAVSARRLDEEKEKLKSLVTDISHQTKTPIANLLLYTELLTEKELPEDCRELVDALDGQAKRLRFLMDALIELSRLEAGILELRPAFREVDALLYQIQDEFARKAEEKGIALTVEASGAYAMFDEKWTLEALGNLVDNAIKYTPSGGSVRLRVASYEIFCCIEVIDNGIGIAEEETAGIFQRFYRGGNVGQQEGIGIGLYLARQIVSGEGGYLKVTSTPGEGSTFGMYLPRKEILQNC